MRIKKTSQYIEGGASLSNVYGTSNENGYTQEYINGLNTYSTTEQRIGTWIDGKPLYRKVLQSSSITLNDGVVLSTISNIDKVCNMRGMISSSTGFNQPIGMIYIDTFDRNNYIWLDKGTGEVKYRLKSGWNAINYIMVVVEYTKTTDTTQNTRSISNEEEPIEEEDNR